jgi:hypothetical protein
MRRTDHVGGDYIGGRCGRFRLNRPALVLRYTATGWFEVSDRWLIGPYASATDAACGLAIAV